MYQVTQTRSGSPWTHKALVRLQGPVVIGSWNAFVRAAHGGQGSLLVATPEAVVVVGEIEGDSAHLYDNPVILVPAEPRVDMEWPSRFRTQLIEWRKRSLEDGDPVFQHELAGRSRIVALDHELKTPAGRFRAVVEVESRGEITLELGRGSGRTRIAITARNWYAPGVGLVKSIREESTDDPMLNPGSATLLLERYW